MDFNGIRVVSFESRRASEMADLIRRYGGSPLSAPTVREVPIEENSELTIRSVLNNLLLYQEGWGVGSIKHSATYSGGQSRACTRGYAPASLISFSLVSPYTRRSVIDVAESIPFIELTGWNVNRLYQLKGEIARRGIAALTGLTMPVFPKRRFQHGAVDPRRLNDAFSRSESEFRRRFHELYA